MDVSTTFSDIPPPAICRKSEYRDVSDWDSDSSDGVVVQPTMAVSNGRASATLKGSRPFESDSGDADSVGVFQRGKKQEAGKQWQNEDEDGEESDLHEKDKKNSTNIVASVDSSGLNCGSKDTTGRLKKDDRKLPVNTSHSASEKSKGVAEGRKNKPVIGKSSIRHGSRNVDELSVNDLTLSEAAKHRIPNLSWADDVRPCVEVEQPEMSLEDSMELTRTVGFRSNEDCKDEATTKEELKLANNNLLQQLDKECNDGQLSHSQNLRMNPSGTGSSEDHSPPTRREPDRRKNYMDKSKPKLSANNDTSDEADDTRDTVVGFVGDSGYGDLHLIHSKRISRRSMVATDFANREQKRTDCGSSDDEPLPTDGIVFKFFQVRRKHLPSELPPVVVEGTVSRLREPWRQTVTHCWREFFAALSLVLSVLLLFIVELFLFVFRDIFYEVVCQLALIFGTYFMKPLVTIVLFNTIILPVAAFLWNFLHAFRRATQPLICLLRDVSLVLGHVLKSFRLVEVFKQNSTERQSRRERIRSTTGIIKVV